MKSTFLGLAAAAFVGHAAANWAYGPDANPACSDLSGGADAYDICDKNTGECVNIMSYNLYYHWDDAWKEPENCGACGHTCPGDDSVCSMGECCPHSSPLYCPKTQRCHKAAPYSGAVSPNRAVRMARHLAGRSLIPIENFHDDDPCECPEGYVHDDDAPNTCRSCAEENAIQIGDKCHECRDDAIADDKGLYCLCPPGLGYVGPDAVEARGGGGHHNKYGCKPCGDDEIADENSVCQPCEGKLEPNKWATECVCPAGWVPNTLLAEKCEECQGDKIAYKGNCISCPENTVPNNDRDQCVCMTGYAWLHDACTKCGDVGANYNSNTKGCTCPDYAQFDEDYNCHCKPGMELVEKEDGEYECKECAHDLVSEDGLKCHQCPTQMTASKHSDECVCDIWGSMPDENGQCRCPENMQEIYEKDLPFFLGMSYRGYCACDYNAVPSPKYESGCKVCKDLEEPRVPNHEGTSCVRCSINKQPNAEGTECECKPGYELNEEQGCDKIGGGDPVEEEEECDGADLQTDPNNCGECGNVCKASSKPDNVKDRWWWRWWGAVGQYRPQKKGECSKGKCI